MNTYKKKVEEEKNGWLFIDTIENAGWLFIFDKVTYKCLIYWKAS